MYSPYILRYRYCRHVTLDVFWLKVKKAFRNVDTLFSISLSLSLSLLGVWKESFIRTHTQSLRVVQVSRAQISESGGKIRATWCNHWNC